MYVHKFNDYTREHYTYDLDNYDYFAPMLDDSIHECKECNWLDHETTVCEYCNTDFAEHEKLLYHLAYHNYDVRAFVKPIYGDHKRSIGHIETLSEDIMRLIDIKKN